MDLKRWVCAAALLLSAGTLANCSRIFDRSGAQGEGVADTAPIGAGSPMTQVAPG